MSNEKHYDVPAAPCSISWTDRDTAALQSVNIPLQSRLSRSRKASLRRDSRPQVQRARQSQPTASANDYTHQQSHATIDQCKGGTIKSPRKVVKKLCLGPEWRVTDWERAKAGHLRIYVRPSRKYPRG